MNWLIGLGVCLALSGTVAIFFRQARLSRLVDSLKEAARVELGTAQIGNARALEERLADLAEREAFPILAGRVELANPSSHDRQRALAVLRAVAVRGADEIFADQGGFWLLIGGHLNPFRVGGYFLGELEAHKVHAVCSWAYTASADPPTRRELRNAATHGIEAARAKFGLAVKIVGAEAWDDIGSGGQIADSTIQERREKTGLTRLEFSAAVGQTLDSVICWETGRDCAAELADTLAMRLGLIEKAIGLALKARESAGR